jgi:hypothetical protein
MPFQVLSRIHFMPGDLHFDDFWMVKEEAFELFYAGEEFYKVMFEVGAFAM